MYKRLYNIILICIFIFLLSGCVESEEEDPNSSIDQTFEKPVIYLYPKVKTNIEVILDIEGSLVCTYPEYKDGWYFEVAESGKILDSKSNIEYNYLFWEASIDYNWDIKEGFIVDGKDTADFLEEKLAYLGLSQEESNDFIVYWLPRMNNNKYNLIHFADKEYKDLARLVISPEPDSILRVFMVWEPLDELMSIEEQDLKSFEREGFTVVEWGGVELMD